MDYELWTESLRDLLALAISVFIHIWQVLILPFRVYE
jgi:hypothetical protein